MICSGATPYRASGSAGSAGSEISHDRRWLCLRIPVRPLVPTTTFNYLGFCSDPSWSINSNVDGVVRGGSGRLGLSMSALRVWLERLGRR